MAQYSKFEKINKQKDQDTGGKWDHLKGRSNVSGMKFKSKNCRDMHLETRKKN